MGAVEVVERSRVEALVPVDKSRIDDLYREIGDHIMQITEAAAPRTQEIGVSVADSKVQKVEKPVEIVQPELSPTLLGYCDRHNKKMAEFALICAKNKPTN